MSHDQARFLKPARLLAIDPDPVVTGPGDPGPGLGILQRGAVGSVQDRLKRLFPAGPVRCRPLVFGQACPPRVFPIEACSTEIDLLNETVTSV